MTQEHNIVIIGGGFAGMRCALSLAKEKLPENTKIRLISDRTNFEYHGALYRIVTGSTPLEVCLPLRDIVTSRKVDVVQDRIEQIDTKTQTLLGKSGSSYRYDSLVIALGAETVYYNIPGLKAQSHGIKTIDDALKLKRHIHETIESCCEGTDEQKTCGSNFVVVGGGATGVEIAAELAVYTKEVAKNHGVSPALMHVELIESQSRILHALPEDFASAAEAKLRSLGVNIFTNRRITEQEESRVMLEDMNMNTKTVVWTAGVRANHLIKNAGLKVDAIGRAVVCSHLKADGFDNIYVAGDAAATPLSGMAQTALQDGVYIAQSIAKALRGEKEASYTPLESIYAIPLGPGWAASMWKKMYFYGKTGWIVRRVVDLVVYLSLLPLSKVPSAFFSHKNKVEDCPKCK